MPIVRVAVIIPAFNEGERLERVLAPVTRAATVDEVVVVDDGSSDDTAVIARRFAEGAGPGTVPVRVLQLPANHGKGGAMYWGAASTDAETVLFLDADLIGLQAEHVDALVQPVAQGEAEMTIGVFRGGRRSTDLSHFLAAWITGQRALRREGFLEIHRIAGSRSGVETAITRHARARAWRVRNVVMVGLTHTMKEEKIGFLRGVLSRMRMYTEIARALVGSRAVPPEAQAEVRVANE